MTDDAVEEIGVDFLIQRGWIGTVTERSEPGKTRGCKFTPVAQREDPPADK